MTIITTELLTKVTAGEIIENNIFPAGGKKNFTIMISTNSFSGTIKILGSLKENVDFTQPATIENPYTTISSTDVSDGANITGDAGISLSADTSTTMLTVNIEALEKIALSIETTGGDAEIIISALD